MFGETPRVLARIRSLHRIVLLGVTALALSVGGCRCGREPPDRGPRLAPLVAPSAPASLPIKGFSDAVVWAPAGATHALPVVVAVLGIGDTPEEQCAAFREIVDKRGFVLCPRGVPNMVEEESGEDAGVSNAPDDATPKVDDDAGEGIAPKPTPPPRARHQVGFLPVDLTTLDREITAGLAALKARFGPHVDDGEVLYAGFSRGAFLGASLIAKHPSRFSRAILIEGGQSAWQRESAAAFKKGGGKRLLFACGRPSCVEEVEQATAILEAQKIETKLVHGVGEGHGYKKQVKSEVERAFDWVVDGDPRW